MAESLFARIVVATDGSEVAAGALRTAIDLARQYRSELLILAVAPLAPVFTTPNEPFVPPAIPESTVPRYRAIVEAAVAEAQAAGVDGVTGVCEEGVVVDEILDHLHEEPADLLVVGSRGLSAAKRILLGSVSTALVNRAPCPVLVVRPRAPTPPEPER